jgi:hypothetical protein
VTRQQQVELYTKKRSNRFLQGTSPLRNLCCECTLVLCVVAFCLSRLAEKFRESPDIIVSGRNEDHHAVVATRLPSHRLCRMPHDQVAGYVCRGPEYDAFADKLAEFIEEETPSRQETWGRRKFPFPANSTILAVGNSLTRQLFEVFPCQYRDVLVSWIDREANSTNAMRRATFYEGSFENGAKLITPCSTARNGRNF